MIVRLVAASVLLSTPLFAQSTPVTPPPTEQSPQALPDAPGTPAQAVVPTGPTAIFDTTLGRMSCKLYQSQAPLAVANFIGLAEGTKDWIDPLTQKKMRGRPLFNGTTFHRVIPEFMIQGGDPRGDGTGDPGYYFADELDPSLAFDVPGRLAMANSGPGTNGSQFFITEAPQPQLTGKHTIFGQCDTHSVLIEQTIARVQRDANGKPVTPVVLDRVTIVREGQAVPPDPFRPPASVSPVSAPPAPSGPPPASN